MNETLKIEQAYYRARGLVAEHKDNLKGEWLENAHGRQHPCILFSSLRGFTIMQREEINIKFQSYGVIAGHADGTSPTSAYYGGEYWKTNLWVLNAAIVIAATDKLNRMNYQEIATQAGVRVCINYQHNEHESIPSAFLWIMRGDSFKICKKVYATEGEAWEAACVDNGLLNNACTNL